MSTDKNLLLAILAMDSYNQGYGEGLKHNESIIGAATRQGEEDGLPADELLEAKWKANGFYAAAYEVGGEIVISYRGTDDFNVLNGSNDVINGWTTELR